MSPQVQKVNIELSEWRRVDFSKQLYRLNNAGLVPTLANNILICRPSSNRSIMTKKKASILNFTLGVIHELPADHKSN